MSKISLAPDVAGTGIFTIASPNSNTNRTLTLPDDTGTIVTNSGNQAGSFTTLNTSGAVVFNDAGADVDFRVEGDTDANLLFVDASTDRVGIGKANPEAKLNVSGSTSPQIWLESTDTNKSILQLIAGDSAVELRSTYNTGGSSFVPMTFYTSGTERMRIDASGDVGIGTSTTTDGKATIYNTSGNTLSLQKSTGAPALAFGSDTTSYGLIEGISGGGFIFYGGNGTLTERARIASGGEFLINATSAIFVGRKLQAKNSGSVAVFKVEGSFGSEVLYLWNDATSGNNLFQEFGTEAGVTTRGSIDYNRGAGLVGYNTSSDANLKNILGDSDGTKSVEILNSTRIREFAWKDDEAQKPQIGVIAQELYETFKGAVSIGGDHEETIPAVTKQRLVSEAVLDGDGNEIEAAVYETVEVEPERTETKYRPWAVDKTAFTFHLVAGWQAHEKLIKQQAETIAALEARIAALEANNGV